MWGKYSIHLEGRNIAKLSPTATVPADTPTSHMWDFSLLHRLTSTGCGQAS